MNMIPAYLRDRVTNIPFIKTSDDVTVFFTHKSQLSNHHPSEFDVDGQTFTSAEQFVMYRKCQLFGAENVARDILDMRDPVAIKLKAKKLTKFSADTWSQQSPDILYEALCAKFTQNDQLKVTLLATADTRLGEACKDPLFGTGLPLTHTKALDVTQWTGVNLQGTALMRVRQALRDGTI